MFFIYRANDFDENVEPKLLLSHVICICIFNLRPLFSVTLLYQQPHTVFFVYIFFASCWKQKAKRDVILLCIEMNFVGNKRHRGLGKIEQTIVFTYKKRFIHSIQNTQAPKHKGKLFENGFKIQFPSNSTIRYTSYYIKQFYLNHNWLPHLIDHFDILHQWHKFFAEKKKCSTNEHEFDEGE